MQLSSGSEREKSQRCCCSRPALFLKRKCGIYVPLRGGLQGGFPLHIIGQPVLCPGDSQQQNISYPPSVVGMQPELFRSQLHGAPPDSIMLQLSWWLSEFSLQAYSSWLPGQQHQSGLSELTAQDKLDVWIRGVQY